MKNTLFWMQLTNYVAVLSQIREKQDKHHSEESFLRRAFYSYPSFHLHQIFEKEKNKERRRDKN